MAILQRQCFSHSFYLQTAISVQIVQLLYNNPVFNQSIHCQFMLSRKMASKCEFSSRPLVNLILEEF